MAQAQGVYVERALFMVGDPKTGKSTQFRSMFLDWRLGRKGNVPTANRLCESYPLSNDRWLYLNLTSPHERPGTLNQFLNNYANKMQPNGLLAHR
jgi:hypothetical protein